MWIRPVTTFSIHCCTSPQRTHDASPRECSALHCNTAAGLTSSPPQFMHAQPARIAAQQHEQQPKHEKKGGGGQRQPQGSLKARGGGGR